MASSDEEGEILPDWVTDFEFFDQENQHVSFACLPLLQGQDETVDNQNMRIYLSGTCNDGLEKFYKQVIAWRYELSYVQPEISLLCKGKHWIKLLKPKKIFEATIRSILVTVHCLHFVKHNPETSEEVVWCHLSRVFSTYEVSPCEADLVNHIQLIKDATENDNDLASSEYMLMIQSEQPTKREVRHMEGLPVKKAEFIVDEAIADFSELDDSYEEEELFDTCCSLCDNGGNILCCEGRCMRSFHATRASGEGSCESLGLSEAQVNAIPNFFCKNCQHQRHQCFICGKLGSSDVSSNAEVFPCVSASCGRFYHPKCVAVELQKRNNTRIEELEKKIAAGESFVCPAHKCFVCKQVENRKVYEMQFAMCRRCPKSYHRKCLPREIAYEDNYEKGILQRAWDDLLPKHILIYCQDHEIIPELGTPLRNHICFPGTDEEKKCALKRIAAEANVVLKRRKLISYDPSAEKAVWKTAKPGEKVDFSSGKSGSAKLAGRGFSRPEFDAQRTVKYSSLISASSAHEKTLRMDIASSKATGCKSVLQNNRLSSDKPLKAYSAKPGNPNISGKKLNTVRSALPLVKKKGCSSPVADLEMQRRIIALMEDADSSFNVDEFKKQQKVPYTYRNSQDVVDKNLTMGKVEVTVKAIQTALQMINNGGTVDDAKEVCSPEMLRQIPLWKRKLDIYLAPFFRGMRYSSYGRHFTKLEKLQEVVDRLHCYAQDGDTIVDFCCGANDFSYLMKEKLDSVGKKCSFKNYDLFPSKNDFSFEQRDWFEVAPRELPAGSQLIMGLNPPFGVKGALANQFINKALQFKPKLLILIVPPITKRLDTRTDGKRYDLVWEDRYLLSGKSFYLPGSVDTDDKQMSQWNKIPPPLSLWSRPDWTVKHREIARRCGHIWLPGQPPSSQPPTYNYPMEEQQDYYSDFSSILNEYSGLHPMLDEIPVPNYEHNVGNFVMTNDRMISDVPNALSWEKEKVTSFSAVDELEDMEISPINSPI